MFQDPEGGMTRSARDIRQMGNSLMGIMQETGESAGTLASAMHRIQTDSDLSRRWSSGTAETRTRLIRQTVTQEQAEDLSRQLGKAAQGIYKSLDAEDPEVSIRKARNLAISLERQGVSSEMIQQTIFGDLGDFRVTTGPTVWETLGGEGVTARREGERSEYQTLERSRLVHVGAGKFEVTTEEMTITTEKMQQMIERHGLKSRDELVAHLKDLSGWHSRETKEVTDDLDRSIAMEWDDQLRRGGKRLSVESIRQKMVAQREWTRTRRAAPGVFDIMRRAGVDVSTDMEKGLKDILDLDILQGAKFEKLREDRRLAPLVSAIKKFSGIEGVRTEEQFREMTGVIGISNMKSFFKEYAAKDKGKLLGGASFEEFIKDRPIEKMHELFRSMGDSEKRSLLARTLTSAVEKSQRLVQESKLGDSPSNAMHVQLSDAQIKAMKD
jgi:hypothetical protein